MQLDAKMQRRLLTFAGVGALGFAVDFSLTWSLTRLVGLHPQLSRIIAMLVAMSVTYLLNRNFTFQSAATSRGREMVRYFAVNISGALVNYGVFSLILALAPLAGFAPTSTAVLGAAIIAGSGTAMSLNFLGSHFLVFTR